jgi:hypothetical protein
MENVVALLKPANGCHKSEFSLTNDFIAREILFRYIVAVNRLTKQEQLFLIIVLGLLLTGWAVKTYRTAHPPTVTIEQQK